MKEFVWSRQITIAITKLLFFKSRDPFEKFQVEIFSRYPGLLAEIMRFNLIELRIGADLKSIISVCSAFHATCPGVDVQDCRSNGKWLLVRAHTDTNNNKKKNTHTCTLTSSVRSPSRMAPYLNINTYKCKHAHTHSDEIHLRN